LLSWYVAERLIVFAGNDGNFFVYDYMSQKDVDEEVVKAAELKKAKIPSAYKAGEENKLADDIEDPSAYRWVRILNRREIFSTQALGHPISQTLLRQKELEIMEEPDSWHAIIDSRGLEHVYGISNVC